MVVSLDQQKNGSFSLYPLAEICCSCSTVPSFPFDIYASILLYIVSVSETVTDVLKSLGWYWDWVPGPASSACWGWGRCKRFWTWRERGRWRRWGGRGGWRRWYWWEGWGSSKEKEIRQRRFRWRWWWWRGWCETFQAIGLGPHLVLGLRTDWPLITRSISLSLTHSLYHLSLSLLKTHDLFCCRKKD